jgi:hypothetical protein
MVPEDSEWSRNEKAVFTKKFQIPNPQQDMQDSSLFMYPLCLKETYLLTKLY